MIIPAGHSGPDPAMPLLVGREREQVALSGRLDAALAGRGSLVLIGGEAGIGKTTLAEDLLIEATTRGALVLVGRCYDLTETPPYGPWIEALARSPRDPWLPSLPTATLPSDHGGDMLLSQEAIFARVTAYLNALVARQPLVLLLDDLHWADPASLDLLRFVARDLAGIPLLLLATYRSDELTRRHPLFGLLPMLVREARATRLDLRRLEDIDLRELVQGRYGLPGEDEDRLVTYLHTYAEGNPFYTGELLRTLEEERVACPQGDGWALGDLAGVGVPPLLRQVIDGRAARLGTEAAHFLAQAAVIGQEVPLALWATVADVNEVELLGLIERSAEARLLVEEPDGLRVRFAHALIREALYESLPPSQRRRLHRGVGEALLPTGGQSGPDPDAVAYHLRQAGDPRAVEWLVRAGERAWRAYAWLTAAERYEAALALAETHGAEPGRLGWLTFRLASVRRFADGRRALGDAEEAARLARMADDPLVAGAAEFLAGMLLSGYLGALGRGIPRMEAALKAIDALPLAARVPPGATTALDPVPRRGTVLLNLAWIGRYSEALALGERYLAEVAPPNAADWLGGNPYSDALLGLGLTHMALGQPAHARAAFARARAGYDAVGYHIQVWQVLKGDVEVLRVARAHAALAARL